MSLPVRIRLPNSNIVARTERRLQNAKLKYAGNVRARESRYSIITGLLHLRLIPDHGNPF